MKKQKENSKIWLLTIFLLAFALAGTHVPEVFAAAKTTVSVSEAEVGINGTYKIKLKNKKKKAKYSYSSSDANVVTVDEAGNVKGVAIGTAKITVKQELNGIKSNVGKVKVSVKNAELNKDYMKEYNESYMEEYGLILSTQPGLYNDGEYYYQYDISERVKCYNPEAKYSFYSSDEDKLVISKEGIIKKVGKVGIVEVTIEESYADAIRTIGTFEVEIKEPELGEYYTLNPVISKGKTLNTRDFLSSIDGYQIFISDSKDDPDNSKGVDDGNDVLVFDKDEDGNWNGKVKAKEVGTEYLHFWAYDYLEKDYTIYLGYVTVRVAESSVLSDFWFEWEEMGKLREYNKKEGLIISKGETVYPYLRQESVYYTGKYKVKSSNPKIVSVSIMPVDYFAEVPVEHHSGMLYLNLEGKKKGTATITVEAGGIKKEFKVTVK